ncbi:hypothetical protein ACJVC5_07645 [Peredibacter sp. HCB2-198]|uniref:toxin-antitoxin system YwqK family antitoxin n=1 Tax=Peredibacter sp. HCB2-198 TaxID=3383025 RepID=UPI0038B53B97
MKNLTFALTLTIFTTSAVAAVCRLDGKPINIANGKETAGKSGKLVCKTEEGKLIREADMKDGIEVGRVTLINNQGNREVFNQNEKGNIIGTKKVFSPKGYLITEGKFEEGKEYGLHKRYFPNGKIESLIYYPDMRIDYSEDGKIIQLNCASQAYLEEDKKLCGWDNVSSVTVNGRNYTYDKGKLIKFQDLFAKGKLKTENIYQGENETRKTFYSNGKLKSEKFLISKELQTEKDYYENGKLKAEFKYELKDGEVFYDKKTYYENGNPEVEGKFKRDSKHSYDLPIGLRKTYYEITGLAYEENHNSEGQLDGESIYYGEHGRVTIRRVYKNGELVSEKNF